MSETPVAREPFQCDGCGQTDTDPMFHVSYATWQKDSKTIIIEPSFHHDCVPQEFRDMLVGPDHEVAREIIAAADSGTRGADLLAFIESLDHSVQQPSTQEG